MHQLAWDDAQGKVGFVVPAAVCREVQYPQSGADSLPRDGDSPQSSPQLAGDSPPIRRWLPPIRPFDGTVGRSSCTIAFGRARTPKQEAPCSTTARHHSAALRQSLAVCFRDRRAGCSRCREASGALTDGDGECGAAGVAPSNSPESPGSGLPDCLSGCSVRMNGARMPSTADDVLAEIRSAARTSASERSRK